METKEKGKMSSEMNLKELQDLVVSLKLLKTKELQGKKKGELLKIVQDWEEKALADKKDKKGTFTPEDVEHTAPVAEEIGLHNGKKVVSRTPIELNGKKYIDILVETGETFRELAE